MSKKSLPSALYRTLKKHAQDADISDDDELRDILEKLETLNQKVEALKKQAREKKVDRAPNVVQLKPRR